MRSITLGDLLARLLADALALEHLVAVGVDHAPLLVHHVVVLEHVFADQEVLLLDLLLGFLDLLGEHPRLDRFLVALLVDAAEAVEDLVDAVAREQPHEVVLGRQEEARLARVALAAGATAQLVVDPPRLVALGAADEQPAGRHHALAAGLHFDFELGEQRLQCALVAPRCRSASTPSLASCWRARCSGLPPSLMSTPRPAMLVAIVTAPGLPGLGDDVRLARGVLGLGVEHRVLDPALGQTLGQQLGDLDRDRAHEHRLAVLVARGDLAHDRAPLPLLGLVDLIVAVRRGPSPGWWGSARPAARRSS